MCSICRQIPCHPRCPNAEPPKPVHVCAKCGEGIFEEDRFFDSPDGPVCEGCIEDMTAKEVLEMLGEYMSAA